MKFLYDDKSFSFEALRTAGYAAYGGADLGEVLVTCRRTPEGDEEAWSAQWAATAQRVENIGRDALAHGHRVSAREALLRASNYGASTATRARSPCSTSARSTGPGRPGTGGHPRHRLRSNGPLDAPALRPRTNTRGVE